jgi:hypothetical protein
MTLTLLAMFLIPFILLVIALGFITLNRYISYKERVALAQLGFSMEDLTRSVGRRGYGNRGVLWGGVITAMSGLALLLGLATLGTGAWLLGGLLPLFVGLGMVLIYFMTLGPAPEPKGGPVTTGTTEGSTDPDDRDATGKGPFADDLPASNGKSQ